MNRTIGPIRDRIITHIPLGIITLIIVLVVCLFSCQEEDKDFELLFPPQEITTIKTTAFGNFILYYNLNGPRKTTLKITSSKPRLERRNGNYTLYIPKGTLIEDKETGQVIEVDKL